METTEEERAWLRLNWNVGEKGFREWLVGSVRAHKLVPHVLRDVDTLEEALEKVEDAMDGVNGKWGADDRLCCFCRATEYNAEAGIVHEGDCPIVKARAALKKEEQQ